MMPFARIDAANSSSRSARNIVRGWTGFGEIWSIGRAEAVKAFTVNGLGGTLGGADAAGNEGRGGRREDNPLPSGLRVFSFPVFILKYFPCQLNIALRAPRTGIVHQNRFSMTGGFRKTDTPRDDRS